MTWIAPAPPRNAGEFYNKRFMKSTNNSYVYHGYQKRTRQNVILKYIPLQGENPQIDQECSIQQSIRFKYVMPVQTIFELDNRYRVLVMEVAKGSLVSGYAEQFFHSPLQVYKIMYQIAKGVKFLHSNDILHGDIKPSNIVLMNDDEYMPFPRIIDFGHAQIIPNNSFCDCNRLTEKFSAPEILRGQPHSYPSDIFALGATFYFLITEDLITHGAISRQSRAQKIESIHPLQYSTRFGPQFPAIGQDLIKSMLNPDPSLRPTIDEVLNSNFFTHEVLFDKDWAKKEIEFSIIKDESITTQVDIPDVDNL